MTVSVTSFRCTDMQNFWQDKAEPDTFQVPDDVVDISFRTRCTRLPVDHAWDLCTAVHRKLPWITQERQCGIHLIHGAESGNGWQRPEGDDYFLLSRRTRFTIRVPDHRREDARTLCGNVLRIADCELEIGEANDKPLSPNRTIFSRHVRSSPEADESAFLSGCVTMLAELGIQPRKIMCGRQHRFNTPQGDVRARSLMLADLEFEQTIVLQQNGLGAGRAFGMGIFIPHKGIDAVYTKMDDLI